MGTEGGAPAGGYPSLQAVDWDGDFDADCQLVGSSEGAWTYDITNVDYSLTGGSTIIERDRVGEGFCSARFTNSLSTDPTRSELQRWSTKANPEFTYEVLYYVPSDPAFVNGTSLLQHKMPRDAEGDCYNGGISIARGGSELELITVFLCTRPQSDGQQRFSLGSLPKDTWFAVRVYFKAGDSASTGAVQAWVDPDGPGPDPYLEKLPLTGGDNQDWDGQGVFIRLGQYRPATPDTTTFYADGFHMDCLANC